jgi:hypothetical protein
MAANACIPYMQYFTSSIQSGFNHYDSIINILLLGEETIARRERGAGPLTPGEGFFA